MLGVHLTLLVGPSVPVPAPPFLVEALESVSVTHGDEGRSGFQLSFLAGRSGLEDLVDYKLLALPLLRPFSRVILIVTFGGVPRVLMDGMITHQELQPSDGGAPGKLTITGEDVSVMMDLQERSEEHPAQDETIIALKIIASYAQYGLIPMVLPPTVVDPPIPIERTPVQQGTDLAYLHQMAARHAYVFYVAPGPAPFTSLAYWGPPVRAGFPQRALSANMGPDTNVNSISFRNDGMAPTRVEGSVQDRLTNTDMPVMTPVSTRIPLVSQPSWLLQPSVRSVQYRDSGTSVTQAYARAQGTMDASQDKVVTATGELDGIRYGDLLMPRALVGVRGVGYAYDGTYYVKSVTHTIRSGSYKQRFTLTREGVGALLPVVRP